MAGRVHQALRRRCLQGPCSAWVWGACTTPHCTALNPHVQLESVRQCMTNLGSTCMPLLQYQLNKTRMHSPQYRLWPFIALRRVGLIACLGTAAAAAVQGGTLGRTMWVGHAEEKGDVVLML